MKSAEERVELIKKYSHTNWKYIRKCPRCNSTAYRREIMSGTVFERTLQGSIKRYRLDGMYQSGVFNCNNCGLTISSDGAVDEIK